MRMCRFLTDDEPAAVSGCETENQTLTVSFIIHPNIGHVQLSISKRPAASNRLRSSESAGCGMHQQSVTNLRSAGAARIIAHRHIAAALLWLPWSRLAVCQASAP
jgi:hypothetical protein